MNGMKILVADDETHILNVVSLKLRNAGFDVTLAADGQEALEKAQANKPDLLITDYHMPRLSGIELCQLMKEHVALADVKKVMLSARGYNLDPSDIEKSGILRMISKPFSPRALLATVDEVLGITHRAA